MTTLVLIGVGLIGVTWFLPYVGWAVAAALGAMGLIAVFMSTRIGTTMLVFAGAMVLIGLVSHLIRRDRRPRPSRPRQPEIPTARVIDR